MLRSMGYMALFLFSIAYWLSDFMNGDLSIMTRADVAADHAYLTAELARVRAENADLQAQIDGLRVETLDIDMLTERLHASGLTLPGQILLYTSQVNN